MLDILVNEKPVYCSKELHVAMKAEAKYEASIAKKERDKTAFVSIAKKLACFLEAAENHNLSHLFKGNAVKRKLPDFLSAEEKEKLTKMYRFPAKEQTVWRHEEKNWRQKYRDWRYYHKFSGFKGVWGTPRQDLHFVSTKCVSCGVP